MVGIHRLWLFQSQKIDHGFLHKNIHRKMNRPLMVVLGGRRSAALIR